MDKAWRHLPRVTREFQEGALKFVNNAMKYNEQLRKSNLTNHDFMDDQLFHYISCPCTKCRNLSVHLTGQNVFDHLVCNGMDPTYTNWVLHGEPSFVSESSHENIEMSDAYRMYVDALDDDILNHENGIRQDHVLKDAELPLYSGSTKSTKLSATLALYKIKTMNGLSTNSFNELLKTINDYIIPDENLIPKNNYETKKLLKAFNLNYEKIHACVNDCCLFRKELADIDACPKCKTSRYKKNNNKNGNMKRVPMKVLRYFSIIPRRKRMFKSQEIAEQLRWHDTNKSSDGRIRHPVDSLAWKMINKKWPSFASDPRNLRFGLATDGFNPFANLSSTYSCWPVMLAIYNLPPWLCMKKEYLMLSLLIPGPKQPALRGLLPKSSRIAIFRYCAFFNEICQRVIDPKRLEDLENEIADTLCLLERYMKVLKGYVKNPARPEGCIAERYITEECIRYCSDYMEQAAEIGVRHSRNEGFQNDSPHVGRPISKGTHVTLSNEILKSAHRYVLFNTEEVEHYENIYAKASKNSFKCSQHV